MTLLLCTIYGIALWFLLIYYLTNIIKFIIQHNKYNSYNDIRYSNEQSFICNKIKLFSFVSKKTRQKHRNSNNIELCYHDRKPRGGPNYYRNKITETSYIFSHKQSFSRKCRIVLSDSRYNSAYCDVRHDTTRDVTIDAGLYLLIDKNWSHLVSPISTKRER